MTHCVTVAAETPQRDVIQLRDCARVENHMQANVALSVNVTSDNSNKKRKKKILK
jgi:hypothetical protein